ncbi:MAG: efflux RND transporter periplasmic adaptor subunit [Phycisphaerae bacterium]|nr:efflux RND transporter periplasmic adaptor subunit [Phycisphaerae bacterium]
MNWWKHRRGNWAWLALLAATAFAPLAGCGKSDTHRESGDEQHGDHTPGSTDNRIDIPATVRQNLGITFVTVERRPVRSTVRLPGQFELRPEARHEYHIMLPGRIDLHVRQYEHVEKGQVLFRLDSPEWKKLQSDLVSARNAMRRSHAELAVAEARLAEIEKAVEFDERRLGNLAEAQVRQVELESALADKRNRLPRVRAELEAARTEFDAAHAHYDVMLSTAASLAGLAKDLLDPHVNEHGHLKPGEPPWRSIDRLTIRAEAPGIVDRLAVTNQGWAETGDLVLDTIDPTALRFHGDALQTDITLFSKGQSARIVPPPGGSIDLQSTIDGTIEIGFQADSEQRTIPIFVVPEKLPRWAKPGVTAYLEVFTNGKEGQVLAIPEAAVVRDGLERVFFLRDRSDSGKVIRTVADLGDSDQRWVEVRSGVMLGDEVVLGGVYPLMLASSSSGEMQEGGHFHADGTFHESDDH